MRKTYVAIVLALVLTCSMFAGVTAENDLYAGERVTLQMMVWGSTENYVSLNDELLKQFPEIANKMDIEILIGGSGDAEVAQKIRMQLAAGERLPDMLRLNYTQFPEFAAQGILRDLTPELAPYRDDIIESVFQVMTYNGGEEILAYPQEVKPKIWYYRTDIFEEAGVDPREIKTVDELIEAAGIVKDKFPGKYIECYLPPMQQYDLMMLISGNGGRFCDDEGNFNVASDENVKEAFEILKKLSTSGNFAPMSDWSADWQAAFPEEILVSQLIGSWMKMHLINWAPEQAGKWGCAMWPEEIRDGSEAGAGIWVVPKDAEYADLAADVLAKYSFDPEFRRFAYMDNGIIPPLKSVLEDETYKNHPYFGESLTPVTMEALNHLKVYPYTPTFSTERTIVMQYLDEYVAGNMTVDEALQAAEDDLKNQIGNAYDAF